MSQMLTAAADQWLVRTSQNVIAGPYPREQILQMIKDRHLRPQDEVCPGNSYWFFLHEAEEVIRFLGAEAIPQTHVEGEEVTETQTQTDTHTETRTVTELTDERKKKLSVSDATHIDEETTGIFTNRTIRQPGLGRKSSDRTDPSLPYSVAPAPAAPTPSPASGAPRAPATEVTSRSAVPQPEKMERSMIAWVVISVMSLLAFAIVYIVLQMLNSKPAPF